VEHIIKSLRAITLVVVAAVVFVLGTGFLVAADATLTPASLGASSDLGQAARWLQFLAATAALAAVCAAGWQAVLRSEWVAALEIAVAAMGTLLVTIGTLAIASSNAGNPAAEVIGAVGVGIWALLVLSRAARASLAEQAAQPGQPDAASPPADPPSRPADARPGQAGRSGQADLWLAAAVGLFVLAIGYGFSSAASSRGPGIAAGLLEAAGVAVLAGSVVAARGRGLLRTGPVPGVLGGLTLLAASFLAAAIVAGLGIATLTALGVALAITAAIELAAFVALALAAWTRVRDLYR
jgi:hypothetical protein